MSTRRGLLYYTAWTVTLLPSSLTLIVWREIGSGEPAWWPVAPLTGLLLLMAGTFVFNTIRELRGYICLMLTLFIMGLGGGWSFGVIPWVRTSEFWVNSVSKLPSNLSQVAVHTLRLTPAICILTASLFRGKELGEMYLKKGDITRRVKPSRLLGVKNKESWFGLALKFSAIFGLGTLIFLVVATKPDPAKVLDNWSAIPYVVIIASMNAFNEEFTLRAFPLSLLSEHVGEENALGMTTLYFALGHYYGIPHGVTGVVLAGFLGWFIGKSIIETKGFFLAWLTHFVPDVVIFGFLLIYG